MNAPEITDEFLIEAQRPLINLICRKTGVEDLKMLTVVHHGQPHSIEIGSTVGNWTRIVKAKKGVLDHG